jgi:hypothetical protein
MGLLGSRRHPCPSLHLGYLAPGQNRGCWAFAGHINEMNMGTVEILVSHFLMALVTFLLITSPPSSARKN